MQPTIDLTCCCKKDFDLKIILIVSCFFITFACSIVFIGDLALQEADLNVEKSFSP